MKLFHILFHLELGKFDEVDRIIKDMDETREEICMALIKKFYNDHEYERKTLLLIMDYFNDVSLDKRIDQIIKYCGDRISYNLWERGLMIDVANKYKGVAIHKIAEMFIKSGNPTAMMDFAKCVEGAPIEKLVEAAVQCEVSFQKYRKHLDDLKGLIEETKTKLNEQPKKIDPEDGSSK